MKKYIIVTITSFLIIILSLSFICETQAMDLGSISAQANSFIAGGEDNSSGSVTTIGNIVVNIVRLIGQAVSVVALVLIGIRYIVGSIEERAEYKQTMWIYIVGSILLFSGSTVVQIIYDAFH